MTNNLEMKKLEQLIKEQRFEEAKAILDAFFAKEWTKEEKGEMYVQLMMMYMQITNRLNEEYLQTLDETIATIKEINTSYDAAVTKTKTKSVR
jgi:flagellin-specific chaperone FliS